MFEAIWFRFYVFWSIFNCSVDDLRLSCCLIYEQADIDNSGTIDYGEFLAATLHLNKIEREDNLVAAFSYFDKDGSGYITIDELQHSCKEFGLGDVHLDEIIKEIDQDNVSPFVLMNMFLCKPECGVCCCTLQTCGLQDGRIDYEEFAAMMKKGDGGGVGRSRTMRNNLNFNLADAFGIKDKS